jgi:hypothetical protein
VRPRLRSAYNATYSAARYERYSAALAAALGCEAGFRLAETPVFFARELVERCARAASEIVKHLATAALREPLMRAVPERFRVGDGAAVDLPQFAVVDFGIARDETGALVPRLVELQGFPSLLSFQVLQSDAWLAELATVAGVDPELSPFFGGLHRDAFLALARRTLFGDADPDETVLVDVAPATQKTFCDFAATRVLFGIPACDPRELYVRDRRLHRRDARGRERRVARLYNRIVGDDLVRPDLVLPFDLRDDLGVTWAPHPRWFWAWSKAALPYLDHPAAPRTRVLSTFDRLPDGLTDSYVLKPLFSFAGAGVNVRPTAADIAAIPERDRAGYCLQEKIAYDPALVTPEGDGVKIEIRVMLLRPDDEPEFVPATNLVRLSRGEMNGVDYNRDRTWVGSSVGLW